MLIFLLEVVGLVLAVVFLVVLFAYDILGNLRLYQIVFNCGGGA